MPRFVILTHDWPFLHWDLMLEQETSLQTWRLLNEPTVHAPIAAEPLPPHRLAYLDYEGPVSGGRGTVTRWDQGTYEIYCHGSGELTLDFLGQKIGGAVILTEEGSRVWFNFSGASIKLQGRDAGAG